MAVNLETENRELRTTIAAYRKENYALHESLRKQRDSIKGYQAELDEIQADYDIQTHDNTQAHIRISDLKSQLHGARLLRQMDRDDYDGIKRHNTEMAERYNRINTEVIQLRSHNTSLLRELEEYRRPKKGLCGWVNVYGQSLEGEPCIGGILFETLSDAIDTAHNDARQVYLEEFVGA